MPIFVDSRGEPVPFGMLRKRWHTDFDDAPTLPDWLTLGTSGDDAGSSVVTSNAAPGGVKIVTAASAGATATLTTDALDLSGGTSIIAARLRIAYTKTDDQPTGGSFGFIGASGGAWVGWDDPEDQLAFTARATGPVDTDQTIYLDTRHGSRRYVLSVWVDARDGSVAAGEGDVPSAWWAPGAALALGTVTPTIQIRAASTPARVLHIHQVTIERWWA